MTRVVDRAAAPPRLAVRMVAGVLAGVGLAVAFPPVDALGGWLAVPAVAAVVAATRGLSPRRGALVGLASGLAFFGVLLQWMRVLGPDAWILLALLCAAFWAGAGALMARWAVRPGWLVTVPLLWVVIEALRERIPWGGFPWGRLAFSQADTALVGYAALGGPALVSLAVAACAVALLRAWDLARGGHWPAALLSLGLIGAVAAGGALLRSAPWGGPDGQVVPLAVVQGNVPRLGLDFNAQRRAVLDNHVRATQDLAAEVSAGRQPQPVAVLWPENSTDIDPLRSAEAAAQIDRAAEAIGVPILVGAVSANPADPPDGDHPGTILNLSLPWDPEAGPGPPYVKRHPVPFGEYLPFRDILAPLISRFDRVPRDFAPGSEPGFLMLGPVPIGVVICFEIAYDDLVRDAVRAGGAVLVVQTNNATYGRTGQPEQQLAISRVQAVTSGRTTLVAATSGISAAIGPDGDLMWRAPEFVADTAVLDVALRAGTTPAVRLGWAVEAAGVLLLAGALVVARRRRLTPRSQ